MQVEGGERVGALGHGDAVKENEGLRDDSLGVRRDLRVPVRHAKSVVLSA